MMKQGVAPQTKHHYFRALFAQDFLARFHHDLTKAMGTRVPADMFDQPVTSSD